MSRRCILLRKRLIRYFEIEDLSERLIWIYLVAEELNRGDH